MLPVEDEATPTPGWWDCQLLLFLMVLVNEVLVVIVVKVVVMLAVGVVGWEDLEEFPTFPQAQFFWIIFFAIIM